MSYPFNPSSFPVSPLQAPTAVWNCVQKCLHSIATQGYASRLHYLLLPACRTLAAVPIHAGQELRCELVEVADG